MPEQPTTHTLPHTHFIAGTFTAGMAMREKEQLLVLIDRGITTLTLDMTGVTAADIAGVNTLVQVYKYIRGHGGYLVIRLADRSPLATLLHLTKFDKWFTLEFVPHEPTRQS